MNEEKQPYLVPAVEVASRILGYLQERGQGASIPEIVDGLSIPRSSAVNILRTLESARLLAYDEERRRYNLGTRLIDLGRSAVEQRNEVAVARPYLQALTADTRLTSLLAQRLPDGYVFIDRAERPSAVRITAEVGYLYPWRAGSPSKVFLACLPVEEREALLAGTSAFGATFDRAAYRAELETVRRQGYGVSRGEVEPGVNSAAAAIPDSSQAPRLALAILGTSSALPDAELDAIGARLRAAACAIARELGVDPRPQPGSRASRDHSPVKS